MINNDTINSHRHRIIQGLEWQPLARTLSTTKTTWPTTISWSTTTATLDKAQNCNCPPLQVAQSLDTWILGIQISLMMNHDHCCQQSCWKYIFDLLTLPGGSPPSWSWPPPRRWQNRAPNSRCSMSLTLPGRAILTPHHIIRLSTWRRHPTWAVSCINPIILIFQST